MEAGTPPTAEEQLKVVKKTCENLADISCSGYEMAVVHGNGPQVGRLVLQQEIAAAEQPDQLPAIPFDCCGAMTEGYIGYQIQQSLRDALRNRNRNVPVVTLVTQVVVDKDDPAFEKPTKPIGRFYNAEDAKKMAEEKGWTMKEDSGRGWRRVVPSPKPKRIVELDSVKRLWDTTIVVTAGGGGIPVVENMDGSLTGVAAVIDKHRSRERLHQLRQARPEGPLAHHRRRSHQIYGRKAVRRGQHGAEGHGGHQVRAPLPRQKSDNNVARQSQGRPRKRSRHSHHDGLAAKPRKKQKTIPAPYLPRGDRLYILL